MRTRGWLLVARGGVAGCSLRVCASQGRRPRFKSRLRAFNADALFDGRLRTCDVIATPVPGVSEVLAAFDGGCPAAGAREHMVEQLICLLVARVSLGTPAAREMVVACLR